MFRKASIMVLVLIIASLIGGIGVHAASTNNVKDFLDYLSKSEVTQLQTVIENIKDTHQLDAVIVITDNTSGKSSMNFADDYYDNNGYGVGSDYSGLLMLVNMQNREVWISTTGRAINIFTDSRISKMVDHVTSPLSDGDFSSACSIFLSDIIKYAEAGVPSGQYSRDSGSNTVMSYKDKVYLMMNSYPPYIFAFIVALIATLIVSYSSKGRVTIDNRTYEENGSFALNGKRDDFLRENTTRIRVQSNSSSTHRGSSGRRHGGGGGRF